jgi:hypothetical protein
VRESAAPLDPVPVIEAYKLVGPRDLEAVAELEALRDERDRPE